MRLLLRRKNERRQWLGYPVEPVCEWLSEEPLMFVYRLSQLLPVIRRYGPNSSKSLILASRSFRGLSKNSGKLRHEDWLPVWLIEISSPG